MSRLKQFVCVWICCSAAACAEQHHPAADGDDSDPASGASSVQGDETASAPDAVGHATAPPSRAASDDGAAVEPGVSAGDTRSGPPLLEPWDLPSGVCDLRSFDLPPHTSATSTSDPCTFRGDWKVLRTDAVSVLVGDVRRASGLASDGFRVQADRVTVTLLGAACSEALAGATVTVELLCEITPLL